MGTLFSRRAVLAGLTSGAALSTLPINHAFAALDDKPFYFLTPDEARFLAALCDTLIPEDDFPSASQAGVVDFIDLQLAGPYGKGQFIYMQPPFPSGTPEQGYQVSLIPATFIRQGIAALMEAETGFVDADTEARSSVLTRLSEDDFDLGDLPAKPLFDELWTLTNQGYFADPIYGGNEGYAGWEMVGFPGAHAYYLSFVDKHNVPYPQPPTGINHEPGGDGRIPSGLKPQEV
ncbi:gluconate 2-dehydrogenase subunit 3 family protein [Anianabacter salinae]|uniref:gluconate 2-dehydrogenase subunit 3 family protein n=1 Tax=Anianabacter salinae TaxID=2851023 RepID=UPI00225DD449|nr:gluconate 2-dehydrogenase subunit 3 family protein [Anianabacter salinae]MBV0911193.1 gluconate 2-dehydrogenase subunit 3 family protein [Anianabacter salinae]